MSEKRVASHLRASGLDPLVVVAVVVHLVLDGIMLSQELLRLGERGGRVLRRHSGLCAREPGLEVVEVAQEALQLRGFAQTLLALLHGAAQLLPHFLHVGQPRPDLLSLFRVFGHQLLGLGALPAQLPLRDGKTERRENVYSGRLASLFSTRRLNEGEGTTFRTTLEIRSVMFE